MFHGRVYSDLFVEHLPLLDSSFWGENDDFACYIMLLFEVTCSVYALDATHVSSSEHVTKALAHT